MLPAPNQSGTTTITLTVTDADGATAGSHFLLAINSPNRPPTLNAMSNVTISEDAPVQTANLTGITAGAPNENQFLTVTAASSNPALIPNPAVNYTSPNSTGTLSFKPAPDAHGEAIISVTVRDNGGTANGGIDAVTKTFLVTVTPVNDAPTLALINDVSINEDFGERAIGAPGINLAGISAGGGENQTLTVNAVSNNPFLLPNPIVSYASPSDTGILTFASLSNVPGSALITVVVTDDGGVANGGVNAVTNTFVLTVRPVNDAPSFTRGDDQVVAENSEAHSVVNWATNISAGPSDEANQTLVFQVTNDNNALFSAQPAISPNGTLTFTPASHAHGVAEVTVTLKDNGSTANGGVDTSAPQVFKITVTGNTPPTVNLTRPAFNASFTAPANIVLEATATDIDGTVSKVEFFQGTTKLGEDTSAPYQWTWSNVAAGSYALTSHGRRIIPGRARRPRQSISR